MFPVGGVRANVTVNVEPRLNADWAAYWRSVEAGDWEPVTFRILHAILLRAPSGAQFLDLGAWIGEHGYAAV